MKSLSRHLQSKRRAAVLSLRKTVLFFFLLIIQLMKTRERQKFSTLYNVQYNLSFFKMSITRDYSRDSRSYYSRSSSYGNLNRLATSYSSSNLQRTASTTRIERSYVLPPPPPPPLIWEPLDDPFFFQRRASRLFDDFDRRVTWYVHDDITDREVIKQDTYSYERTVPVTVPVTYREYQSSLSTTRNIPVQYTPLTTVERREKIYRKIDDLNDWTPAPSTLVRTDESYEAREGRRTAVDNWSKQDYQYSDSSHRQRKMSIPY
ncbi:unnamed protein product [Adineta ricciae]|uniref:Uncharacterized protein n=1 Tax=Adineta ricciae TaxID=249248 RepID=A0A815UQA2_ADIRI|nr:unnamed protein product [Adineta ricciae]